MEYKLGARGLRSICEAIMIDAMFDIPSEGKTKNVHITLEYAKEKLSKAKMDKLRAA
jgi:ATP-dependent Clp protease ATP-binding subunit ClpX